MVQKVTITGIIMRMVNVYVTEDRNHNAKNIVKYILVVVHLIIVAITNCMDRVDWDIGVVNYLKATLWYLFEYSETLILIIKVQIHVKKVHIVITIKGVTIVFNDILNLEYL